MSTAAYPPVDVQRHDSCVPTDPIFRLNVDQYHEMIRSGILTADDRVELLEGWLVPKMSRNPPQASRLVVCITIDAAFR